MDQKPKTVVHEMEELFEELYFLNESGSDYEFDLIEKILERVTEGRKQDLPKTLEITLRLMDNVNYPNDHSRVIEALSIDLIEEVQDKYGRRYALGLLTKHMTQFVPGETWLQDKLLCDMGASMLAIAKKYPGSVEAHLQTMAASKNKGVVQMGGHLRAALNGETVGEKELAAWRSSLKNRRVSALDGPAPGKK